jgi:hypothetical protein
MATSSGVRDQISLSPEEQELFSMLLEAAKHAGTGTTLRCAGGWVRDKLLGLESKDIDVALDNMLGRDFAEKVRKRPPPPPVWLPPWRLERFVHVCVGARAQPRRARPRLFAGPRGNGGRSPRALPAPAREAVLANPRPTRQVNDYLQSQGKETHRAAVIHSNPMQSKHLETARMKVNDLWIDLVNLRSETYAEDSRIPEMEFGTPLQDAERR